MSAISALNSTNAVSFSSACTTKRFPSPRCASAIQIVRPAVIGKQRTASEDLGKKKLYLEKNAQVQVTLLWLFQKQIHAIEIDDGMIFVQRIDPQDTADSCAALLQREIRQLGNTKFRWRRFEVANFEAIDFSGTDFSRGPASKMRRDPCCFQRNAERSDESFMQRCNKCTGIDEQTSRLPVDRTRQSPPKRLQSAIISRLKIMSGSMSIAEKRLPQDGRIQVRIKKKPIDLRVSTMPTNHRESMVLRILDKSSLKLGLPELGFFSDDQETFEHLLKLPDGILLVTGPTGSGKTTTLYACLNYINKPDRKIITVEEPIEYQMTGINQVQVNTEIGMTFPAALRSILRQAPNIIMIGEIRDLETASIATNASLTGHLVFSTLHTNDAPSAVPRLIDLGVQPFLVASSVRAVLAQRLIRRLCNNCKQPGELTDTELRALQIDRGQLSDAQVMRPVGCELCRQIGYKGRMGIFEIFVIDDEVRHMINKRTSTFILRQRARELGMRTLREDGVRKVLAGLTSAEEVISITVGDVS
jgi:Tfp pilus assembly pilus retraction ATPase PilT